MGVARRSRNYLFTRAMSENKKEEAEEGGKKKTFSLQLESNKQVFLNGARAGRRVVAQQHAGSSVWNRRPTR